MKFMSVDVVLMWVSFFFFFATVVVFFCFCGFMYLLMFVFKGNIDPICNSLLLIHVADRNKLLNTK